MTPSKRKKIFFGLLLGCYCMLCAVLVIWTTKLIPQQTPQIDKISLNTSKIALEISGKNLNQPFNAIITASTTEEDALIAKRFTWGDAYDIQINKGIAWVGNHKKGIIAYNIDDPSKPYAISSLELPKDARVWRITITDHYLITSSSKQGMNIIDILDPKNPQLLSSLPLPGLTNQVVVKDNLAIIATGNFGLHIVNIEDKRNPRIISSLPLEEYIFTVCTKGNLAFLSGGSHDEGITYTIDLTSPENPQVIKKIFHPAGKIWDSLIVQNTLYCGTSNGLTKVNLNTLEQKPEKITEDIRISRLYADKKNLYIVSRDEKIYQYLLDENLSLRNLLHSPRRSCRAIAVLDNYAFVASNAQGLSILDINKSTEKQSPIVPTNSNIVQNNFFYTSNNNIAIFGNKKISILYKQKNRYSISEQIKFNEPINNTTVQYGNKIFFSINRKGIYTLNIDSSNKNIKEDYLPCSKNVRSISVYKDKLYICLRKDKILVADISSGKPILINEKRLNLDANLIAFKENKAFVDIRETKEKESSGGFYIYNFSDNNFNISSYIPSFQKINRTNTTTQIVFKKETLLVCSSQGFVTIDISNIEDPEILDSVEFSESCKSFQVVGDIAYINHNHGGISFTDISNPRRIRKLGHLETPDRSWVFDGQLYVFDKSGDMTVCPEPLKLHKTQSRNNKCSFELPVNFPEGDYDVFFSDEKKYIRVKKALTLTPEKTWKINLQNIKKHSDFDESV